ncbi:hypothetical protein ONS95_010582 [Cadophora gregata]|uniref:uncharacterized protein n=1 Tax=Cadophora gregata TaxID=51156 RepID=UPI0026DBD9B6|nr:uncharacterized protein ONS95_010582 [Cadophora gregata]KAK0122341.1 hypothetical protein ONS95_010582 [Cadophora gregata]
MGVATSDPVTAHPQPSQSELPYRQSEYQRRFQKWEEKYQQAHGHLSEGLGDIINSYISASDQVLQPEPQPLEGEHEESQHTFPEGMESMSTDLMSTWKPSEAEIQRWNEQFWGSTSQCSVRQEPLVSDEGLQDPQQPLSQTQQNFAPQNLGQDQSRAGGEALSGLPASQCHHIASTPPPQTFNLRLQPELLAQQQLLPESQSEKEQPVPVFSGQIAGDCRIQCPDCILKFMNRQQLHSHEGLHLSTKPHICPFFGCNARFNDKIQMKNHISGHNGQIMCGYCGEFFLSWQALTWHKRQKEHS